MILLVHGGAAYKRANRKSLAVLAECLEAGYAVLRGGGPAVDAVAVAITVLEDSGIFNAGLGGNLQMDGVQRLDASLMEGKDLHAGAVVGLEGIRNPIQAAMRVMDLSHVMLTNVGARKIARGLARLPKPSRQSQDKLRRLLMKEKEIVALYREYFSTVGAAALDADGTLAAGTSTGGTYAMLPGRVGDTPVIGAGTYAENRSGAVSCTGSGEHILRSVLAREVCMLMESAAPAPAARKALKALLRLGGQAGLLALNRSGRFALMHTTEYMAGGHATEKGIRVQDAFTRVR